MKSMRIAIVVFLLNTLIFPQTTTVHGKLLGVDGKPMLKANISFSTPFEKITKHVIHVAKDGSYTISLLSASLTYLNFAGVNHKATQIPIVNDQDVELNVKLGGYSYNKEFTDVRIIGEFNNFDFNTAKPLIKQTDGTFTFAMSCEKQLFKYQLLNVESSNRSINGTQTEDFEYDGGGDYRSIVSTQNGQVKIIFDPQKLINVGQKESYEFTNRRNVSAILNKYVKLSNDYFEVFFKESKEYRESGKDPKTFKFSGSPLEQEMKKALDQESDTLAKQIGLSYYITLPRTSKIDVDSLKIVEFCNSLDPNSILWEANPNLFNPIYYYLGREKAQKLKDKLFEQTRNKPVKFRLLQQNYSTARFKNDASELKNLQKIVSAEYGELEIGKNFLKQFVVETKIKEGAEIPDFSVKSFDDSTKIISKTSMLGKIYLIDFWATWCGPCVAEMPNIQAVFEKYKDKGFEILSLSLDNGTREVVAFREKQHRMPWLNAYLGSDWKQPIVKNFEVEGIPKPLLVGKDGKILATEKDLRGEKLDKTLLKYFP